MTVSRCVLEQISSHIQRLPLRKGSGVQATAQAQESRQVEVTKQDSIELIKCLLRVSVFHVAYLRGLFPSDAFRGVLMSNLDNMNLMMLKPESDETSRMISWMEKDINLALSKGFLHRLHFCITKDADGQHLIEQYSYTFTYSPEGERSVFEMYIFD